MHWLSGPAGGTEIGTALAGVTALSQAQDVLLVTDGKSHALDVQALARTGRRFSVVLVGEDSLEANVGHLAALTGGQILSRPGPTWQRYSTPHCSPSVPSIMRSAQSPASRKTSRLAAPE